MAPLKLPPKKPKGKGKQLHIDYATPDSARASAPPDWTAEEWLEEGTRQEEQGERYQVGPKAARHLANASTCYRLAAALSPTSFDPRYNAARVLHTLGSNHLGAPACLEALEGARSGYREALAVLAPEGQVAGEATARIDALYNLAQADATLLAQLDDGIVVVADELERKRALAQEAKELFAEVERLQRIELERYISSVAASSVTADEDGDDVPSSADAETSVQVVETTIVTPRLVIDTLLASIAFDIQLSETSLAGDSPDTDARLRQSAVDAFSRAVELRAVVAAQEGEDQLVDLDLELTIQQIEILTTWSPEEAGPKLDQLVAAPASQARTIDVLSLHADFLVESFSRSSSSAGLGALERAVSAYEQAASLLSNRLSPPKHIPAQQLPSLLSANLASQAHVHLLAYLISSPSAISPHLDTAQQLAIEAIAAAKPVVVLSVSSALSTAATAGALPTISAVRSVGAQEARTDWSTSAAVRIAFFTLVRIRYYACAAVALNSNSDPAALRAQISARVWGEWKALGLAEGRDGGVEAGMASLRRREMAWWLDEIEDDAVARVVGAHTA
ncbi:hypothetical protein JCM10908_007143 [Rhodotorula pacifica]|uniref:uncharacterized protein n=1 Tax=Rhodotorula pacifica TaxID=1495444 RepID=UPI00316E3869